MNVHFHTLVLDGVFTEAPGGALAFHPAPAPSDAEVAAALATIRHRVQQLLVRHGLEPADEATGPADRLAEESPVLAGIVGASVQGRVALGSRAGARVRRLGDARDTETVTSRGPRQAHLEGLEVLPLQCLEGLTLGRAHVLWAQEPEILGAGEPPVAARFRARCSARRTLSTASWRCLTTWNLSNTTLSPALRQGGSCGLHVRLPHLHGHGLDARLLGVGERRPEPIQALLLAVVGQLEHPAPVQIRDDGEIPMSLGDGLLVDAQARDDGLLAPGQPSLYRPALDAPPLAPGEAQEPDGTVMEHSRSRSWPTARTGR